MPTPALPPAAAITRPVDRVAVVVVPFGPVDDSAVTWALEQLEQTGRPAVVVVHPNPRGVTAAELAEIRVRFAHRLRGRYAVSASGGGAEAAALHFTRASV